MFLLSADMQIIYVYMRRRMEQIYFCQSLKEARHIFL